MIPFFEMFPMPTQMPTQTIPAPIPIPIPIQPIKLAVPMCPLIQAINYNVLIDECLTTPHRLIGETPFHYVFTWDGDRNLMENLCNKRLGVCVFYRRRRKDKYMFAGLVYRVATRIPKAPRRLLKSTTCIYVIKPLDLDQQRDEKGRPLSTLQN